MTEIERLRAEFNAKTVQMQHQGDVTALWEKQNRGEPLTEAEEAAFVAKPEPVAAFLEDESCEKFADRWLHESGWTGK